MKVLVNRPMLVEISYLIVEAELPSELDDDFEQMLPYMFDAGDVKIWRPLIDVDCGKVMGWPKGHESYVRHDLRGIKTLVLDKDGNLVHSTRMLPQILCSRTGEFALECKIDEDGRLHPWDKELIVELLKED